MAQQKSLEELRMEAEELDKQKRGELAMRREEQERQMLQKRINQEKFKRTTLGKVVGGVTTVGEAITRPAKKDTSGKPIAGTGGIGARVVGAFSNIGKTAPVSMSRRTEMASVPQQVQPFDINALERQFSVFGNSAPAPMPMQRQSTIRVSQGVRIKQKVRSKGKKRRGKSVRARRVPMAQPQPVQQQGFNLNDVLSRLPQ